MAAEKKRSVSGSTYVVRNAPSDIVRSRPSSTPPVSDGSAPPLPPPPRVPRLDGPIEEVVERVERFDFAPVMPRSSRPPSAPPPERISAVVPTPPTATSSVRPRVSTPAPARVDRVRTDIDALHGASLVPEEPVPAVDPVASLLLELCRLSPGEVERLRPRLERDADRLLPELVRHFPGPVWFDRRMPHRRLPKASEASPLAAALTLLGERASTFVEELLAHASPDVRFHAALVATELGRPELLAAVAQLVLDADAGVRRAAIAAVEALRASATYPHILEGLRRTASSTTVQQVWRVRSVEALAELGDALALDALVELLGDDDRTIARAAHDALRRLTCHDLGSMRMAWRRWAKSQGRRHRFDWLVDALADRRPELRRMALSELVRASGHSFGLTEDSPRASFVDAQAKYLRWWQSRST